MSAGDATRDDGSSFDRAAGEGVATEPSDVTPGTQTVVPLRYGSIFESDAGPSASAIATADPAASAEAERSAPSDPGACDEARRIADERCSVAARAREQAEAVSQALRAAQLAYDEHQSRADRASLAADPRTIRTAKEAAQHAFRASRAAGRTPEALEAAAREWLGEINRINHEAREAGLAATRERDAATELVTRMERLAVEADAARISTEDAELACLAARQALADCEEASVLSRRAMGLPAAAAMSSPAATGPTVDDAGSLADVLASSDEPPVIIRLLQGDRATLDWLVAELGGPDPSERRRWQVALGGLLEAIVGRAIEAAALDFPDDHGFWSPFTRLQSREIVAALASLSFRFDGLGGWVDDRVPSQRDLSLAVGYAGLDPMRIRHWPNESEAANLFRDVSVAADEYLVEAAGGLTLGELVSLLGRRADELTELWNAWARVRPLLLAV